MEYQTKTDFWKIILAEMTSATKESCSKVEKLCTIIPGTCIKWSKFGFHVDFKNALNDCIWFSFSWRPLVIVLMTLVFSLVSSERDLSMALTYHRQYRQTVKMTNEHKLTTSTASTTEHAKLKTRTYRGTEKGLEQSTDLLLERGWAGNLNATQFQQQPGNMSCRWDSAAFSSRFKAFMQGGVKIHGWAGNKERLSLIGSENGKGVGSLLREFLIKISSRS